MKYFSNIAILVALLSVVFLSSSCSRNQSHKKLLLPKGWYLSLNNTNVSPFHLKEDHVSHQIQFDRQDDTKDAVYFIRVAEAVFPKRTKILDSKRDLKNRSSITNSWYFERLWWHEEYQGYQIPYALTGDAVNYYLDQYYTFIKDLNLRQKNDSWKASNQNRVEYYYSATVKSNHNKGVSDSNSTRSGLTIVNLKMKWSYLCGQQCGWGFEKTREVWFSNKYTIIKILGDSVGKLWKRDPRKPFTSDGWITF